MKFTVLPNKSTVPSVANEAFLLTDHWDDWFRFETMFMLIVFDDDGSRHDVGAVKIGQMGMEEDQRRPKLPSSFDYIGPMFFSLGQDESYYVDLNKLGEGIRDDVLRGLRDIALDLELFDRILDEEVTGISLLRTVPVSTVRGQFHRLATGGARLSRFAFTYRAPARDGNVMKAVPLRFVVKPESNPPSNVHVLIGRNGVGKTTILHQMSRALVEEDAQPSEVGEFGDDESIGEWVEFPSVSSSIGDQRGIFANLVSVTFSAFDPFEPLSTPRNRATGLQYAYVGLKKIRSSSKAKPLAPKTPTALAREFSQSVKICIGGARLSRWRRALEMLEADPIFAEANIARLAEEGTDDEVLKQEASEAFGRLSSGHKVVLLTVTRLVETVEEKSLVLLDEPEAHLHPPLLSAFLRALSDLLVNRNGVAIVATHSPVVLQEVPRDCVWKIRRVGSRLAIDRPDLETFGENVGTLTHEVFGLEVTQSGFHRLIRERIDQGESYEQIVKDFDGKLGGEAKAIIRGLLATQGNAEA